jgi:hypothetical protein
MSGREGVFVSVSLSGPMPVCLCLCLCAIDAQSVAKALEVPMTLVAARAGVLGRLEAVLP